MPPAALRGPSTCTVVHTFAGHDLRVQMLEADEGEVLFDDGELTGGEPFDLTGLHRVWPASVVVCQWLEVHRAEMAGARVLELGAGAGIPSLLCTRLGAARVVAVDGDSEVCRRLNKLFSDTPQASAHQMWFEAVDEVAELAERERINTLLFADVVYPMKSISPLLAVLHRLLHTCRPLRILAASTSRDVVVHRTFEKAMSELAVDEMQIVTRDATVDDPLYGRAPVSLYLLRTGKDEQDIITDHATDMCQAAAVPPSESSVGSSMAG
mgnify:CR=1 FL=1